MKKIELLAPAGNQQQLEAAIANGADAVYLGIEKFNARQKAENFGIEELNEAIKLAHLYGVKVYLTLNIILNDKEIEEVILIAQKSWQLGVDAFIIQDLGLAKILKENIPNIVLHASTQATIYNALAVKKAAELGFSRVVVPRETTLTEIKRMAKENIEIEVFVHGALCVFYSGQCLLSSMIGGRSGNRGVCAQPCRLPYTLLGKKSGEIASGYLYSPKDICLLEYLPDLINSNVTSIKIEGRMKRPEYVAACVAIYRKHINRAYTKEKYYVDKKDISVLKQVFNRGGFSKGYMEGNSDNKLMYYSYPGHLGEKVGEVEKYYDNKSIVIAKLHIPININDGIIIKRKNEVVGGNVQSLVKNNDRYEIGYIKGNIKQGDSIYLTKNSALEKDLKEKSTIKKDSYRKVYIEAIVEENRRIEINIGDENNIRVKYISDILAEKAVKKPIDKSMIIKQFQKSGEYRLNPIVNSVIMDDDLFVTVSNLNEIRRNALLMYTERIQRKRKIGDEIELNTYFEEKVSKKKEMKLSAYFINPISAEKIEDLKVDRIYIPIHSIEEFDYRTLNTEVYIWLNPLIKEQELENAIKKIETAKVDGILAGTLSVGQYLKEKQSLPVWIDYNANVYNSYTLKLLADEGMQGVCLSPEMNLRQIQNIKEMNIETEYTVYGRLPLTISEYCPVGTLECEMSGKNKCKTACEKDTFYIKDRKGLDFPVISDKNSCTSRILNSKKMFLGDKLIELNETNVDYARMYFYEESISDINEIVQVHREILEGNIRKLKGDFTKGHLIKGV